MKLETIKKHISEIAKRDLRADDVCVGIYDTYFPDEQLLDFLAYAVHFQLPISVFYNAMRSNVYIDSQVFGLALVLRKKEYFLGFYAYQKRHSKYFRSFFSYFFDDRCFPIVLSRSDGQEYSYLNLQKNDCKSVIINDVGKCNAMYDCDYSLEFCQIMTNYANTRKILKIIVMNAEGDYYITRCRIWAFRFKKIAFWNIENIQSNWLFPRYINEGYFLGYDRKILQIIDNEIVLYSTEAYTESEMDWRKHFLEDQVRAFCKKLSNQ